MSVEMRTRVSTWLEEGTLLAGVIPASVVLDRFVDLMAPAGPGGIPVAALLPATALLATLALVLRTEPSRRWPVGVTLWLLALGLLWMLVVALTAGNGGALSAPTFLIPVYVLGLVLRCPSQRGILAASDGFATVLVAVIVTSVLLEGAGLLNVPFSESDATADPAGYWLPLNDLVGLDARWAGPFGYPYLAAPLAGFLCVLGVWRCGLRGAVFSTVGIAALLLTGSRTSLLAVAAGVMVVLYVRSARLQLLRPRYRRLAGLVGAMIVLVGAGSLWLVNPGLTGRREIWPAYVELWREAPLVGGGEQSVWKAMESGNLPPWAGTAHNLWLDTATRWGITGLVPVVLIFALGVVLCIRAAGRGSGVGLGLMTMVLVGSLTDMLFDWRYLTPTMAVLTWAVLLSAWDGHVGAVRSGISETA